MKIYPGLLSQAVEGLDSLLRMPYGCFEQTSSVTYPNVLVLDYLKTTKQAKPDVQMKAEQYINVGYQRLLSFEVPGGGFSWFGDAPGAPGAHRLRAAGVPRHVPRARGGRERHHAHAELARRPPAEATAPGTPDQGGIAEGIINRQTGTAPHHRLYHLGARRVRATRARPWRRPSAISIQHWREAKDPYTLAVIANAYFSGRPEPEHRR